MPDFCFVCQVEQHFQMNKSSEQLCCVILHRNNVNVSFCLGWRDEVMKFAHFCAKSYLTMSRCPPPFPAFASIFRTGAHRIATTNPEVTKSLFQPVKPNRGHMTAFNSWGISIRKGTHETMPKTHSQASTQWIWCVLPVFTCQEEEQPTNLPEKKNT